MFSKLNLNWILVALMLVQIGCTQVDNLTPDNATDEVTKAQTVVDLANDRPEFQVMSTLIHDAGLVPVLTGQGPFTVFAPGNAAFEAVDKETLNAVMESEATLRNVLTYHVVLGRLSAATLAQHSEVTTMQGEKLTLDFDGVQLRVNGALVTHADLDAGNGVIHGVESVLIPETIGTTNPEPTIEPGKGTDPESAGILDLAAERSDLSTLVQAVKAAELVDTLSAEGPFTLFAPTNAAFAALPEGALDALLSNPKALADVLTYHVVQGSLNAANVTAASSLDTLQGNEVKIGVFGDAVFINDARIQIVDIEASNGVIHVIDAVLMPPMQGNILEVAANAGGFETLLAAIGATGLGNTLSGPGPFTVFAPTDAAFAALPEGTLQGLLEDPKALTNILTYHVAVGALKAADIVNADTLATIQGAGVAIKVFGNSLMINDAMVTVSDIKASNGIIHVIDAVLLPPPPATIIDVATDAGDFETLLTAIDAAGLTDALADLDKNFTVFAPTDAAFAALPAGTLDGLLNDKEALTQLLLYHVVGSALTKDDVQFASLIPSLNGNDIRVSALEGEFYLNKSKLVVYDIEAANGIIHVIDAVLTQPHTIAATLVSMPETFSTLTTALSVAGLVNTLNGSTKFTVFAPTNAAFAKFPNAIIEQGLANPAILENLLLYHVVPGKLAAEVVAQHSSLKTAQGESIDIAVKDGDVFVNDAKIVSYDIPCTNGIIHFVDAVLSPPTGK